MKVSEASGQPFDHGRFEVVLEEWPQDELQRAQALAETGEGWLEEVA